MSDLATGTEFAGCRIERVLAHGGMGVVYRATELRLGRPVALKLIGADGASDPEVRARFEREARLTASIEHPNVIPVYGAGEEDGHLYLVMRYVAGTDLHALLREEGRLPPARAAAIVAQIADALDAAHAAGLVHRDVKPANVLIGARDHVYLSDFGITRVQAAETRITESGGWIGTVDFMAPEHLRGEPTDARSDVYALGCVLHAALTGTPPFRRMTVPATLTAHLHDAPPWPSDTPGVPATFDAVISRALAKDPDDRYPSAGDLGRAALAAATGEAVTQPLRSVARGEAAAGAEPATAVTRLAAEAGMTAVASPTAMATTLAPEPEPTRHAGARSQPRDGATRDRPATIRVQRGRRRKLALMATGVVLALPAAAAIVMIAGSSSRASGPLSSNEVEDVAQSFAQAYSDEDDAALRRLLTPGVRRIGAGDAQSGRPSVVGEYRRQFAADAIERYELSGVNASGGRAGRAEGRYTVTRRGGQPFTGRLMLGIVRRDGKARIDLIATEPRT